MLTWAAIVGHTLGADLPCLQCAARVMPVEGFGWELNDDCSWCALGRETSQWVREEQEVWGKAGMTAFAFTAGQWDKEEHQKSWPSRLPALPWLL